MEDFEKNKKDQQLENLENLVERHTRTERHLENLKEKYYNTENYIENNRDSIDEEMLRNLQEKQQHREEQINFLEDEN